MFARRNLSAARTHGGPTVPRRRNAFAAAALASAVIALGGCTSPGAGPLETEALGAPLVMSPVMASFADGFQAQELRQLLLQAETQNYTVAEAGARLAEARARLLGTHIAFLPTGSLNFQSSRTKTSASVDGASAISNLHDANLTAAYEIDLWGRLRANRNAAIYGQEASVEDLDAARLTIAAELALAYSDVLAARDRLKTAQANVKLAETAANTIRERVKAGSATVINLAQQETVVLDLRKFIPELERQRDLAEISVATLLGERKGQTPIRVASLSQVSIQPLKATLSTDLVRRRPDVRAAEARVLAGAENVAAARAALLPRLDLTLLAGYQSPLLATLFNPHPAYSR